MGKFSVFLCGLVAALGALFFELLLLFFYPAHSIAAIFSGITSAMLLAVLIEEILKFIFLIRLRDKIKSGALYSSSLIFGAGFAAAEIFFFHSSKIFNLNYLPQLAGVALVHIATCGLMGYFLEKSGVKINSYSVFVIFFVFLFHLAYNAAVIMEKQKISTLIGLTALILILFSLFFHKKGVLRV